MEITVNRNDTALLKGIAIVAIVFHNFCHWIPGAVIENEYNFRVENAYRLVDVLLAGGPHVVMNLFSHLGCYGVPVFLFLSGYGLVRKYEPALPGTQTAGRTTGTWEFIRYNALKLWRLMIAGIILLFAYEAFFTSGWRHGVMNIVYMLTFVTNFLPQTDATFLPKQDLLLGPWWYFSLTMQMYLLYRLAYYRRGKSAILLSAAACIGLQILAVTVFDSPRQDVLHYLRYTFMACLLPFAMGTWVARYGIRLNAAAYAAAWAVFIGGCFNVFLWIVSPVALTIMVLPAVKVRPHMVRAPLEWLGGISAALFTVHPVVRCLFNPRTAADVYATFVCYIAASVLLAWALSAVLRLVPKPKIKWTNNK